MNMAYADRNGIIGFLQGNWPAPSYALVFAEHENFVWLFQEVHLAAEQTADQQKRIPGFKEGMSDDEALSALMAFRVIMTARLACEVNILTTENMLVDGKLTIH